MEKLILENMEIEYKLIDNRKKITLLIVHGYNSSLNAFDNLYLYKDNLNFNIVAINLPISEEYNVFEFASIIDNVIKKIKGRVILFGHSLGGAIIAHTKKKRRIKKYIYASALTPILAENKMFKILLKDRTGSKILRNKIVKTLNRFGHESLAAMLSPPVGYIKVVNENINNIEYLRDTLKLKYNEKKDKSISFIGKKDAIFNYNKYDVFMKSMNIENTIIEKSGHNPVKDAPNKVVSLLNKEIKSGRRIRKII